MTREEKINRIIDNLVSLGWIELTDEDPKAKLNQEPEPEQDHEEE